MAVFLVFCKKSAKVWQKADKVADKMPKMFGKMRANMPKICQKSAKKRWQTCQQSAKDVWQNANKVKIQKAYCNKHNKKGGKTMIFEELIKNKTLEEQATEINEMMKQTKAPYKNSKKFAKETGLGVVFSVVEKYFLRNGYSFINDEFVKVKPDQTQPKEEPVQTISKNDFIANYLMKERNRNKKVTARISDNAEMELQELYEKYPYFNKGDLLYVVIMEGIKNLK